MSEFNIDDLDEVIAITDSVLVQMLALQLKKQIGISKASEQQLAAVVAENAGLKVKGRELLNEACKVYEKFNATINSDSGDFMDGQTLHEFQAVIEAETPATDAYLAEVRASAVEMFVMDFTEPAVMTDGKFYNEDLVEASNEFAAQLRQGAEHE